MIININKDRSVTPSVLYAGTMNENNSTDLTFVFDEELQDYHKRIVFITDDGNPQDIIEGNTYTIKNDITKYESVRAYLLLTKEGDKDWRSIEMQIQFYKNEQPDEYQPTEEHTDLWDTMITVLEDKVTTVDNLAIELQDLIREVQRKLDEGEFNYVLTEDDKQEISDITVPKVEVNIQPILENIENTAKQAEVIARGKSDSVVKDTFAEMEEWLRDISNKGTHKPGDNLYIKAKYKDDTMTERQPDYWIAEVLEEPNKDGYYYEISELEGDKPDLDAYAKIEQFVTLTQAEYDVLSTEGTYTREDGTILIFSANTYYFIIEEE